MTRDSKHTEGPCDVIVRAACHRVGSRTLTRRWFSRHPKQMEREKNHKEALQKEGSVYNTAENAYKSLWYRGASSGDREDSKQRNDPGTKQTHDSGDNANPASIGTTASSPGSKQ